MTNEQLIKKYGQPGANLTTMLFPYPMYYDGKLVKTTKVHKDYAESLKNALAEVYDYYGPDEIKRLGLDQYGGCYNNRKLTGSDDKLSIHAFAAAIDFYPSKNTYTMKADKALFAKPEYDPFIDLMEKHGWWSLGRAKGFDYMHFQVEKI